MKVYCYECLAVNGMFSEGCEYEVLDWGGPLGRTVSVEDALGRVRVMSKDDLSFIVRNDYDRDHPYAIYKAYFRVV